MKKREGGKKEKNVDVYRHTHEKQQQGLFHPTSARAHTHRHLLARHGVSTGIAIRDTRAPLLHQPPIVRAEKLIELWFRPATKNLEAGPTIDLH